MKRSTETKDLEKLAKNTTLKINETDFGLQDSSLVDHLICKSYTNVIMSPYGTMLKDSVER